MNLSHAFIIVLGSFIAFLLSHVILWRLRISGRGVFLFAGLSIVVYGLSILVAWKIFFIVPLSHVAVTTPLYGSLVFLLLHFYAGMTRAFSVRILGEIVAVGGEMHPSALENVYPVKSIFRSRIVQMSNTGWIKRGDNGKYSCTFRGECVAHLSRITRALYGF